MTHRLLSTAIIASGAALLIAAGPKADLNQDGEVTKAEFTQAAQSKFFATDTNNDGLLSQDERKAHRQAMRENRKDRRFERLDINAKRAAKKERRKDRPKVDANGDGMISMEEHMAVSERLFARMDANDDGVLTKGEGRKRKGKRGKKRGQ